MSDDDSVTHRSASRRFRAVFDRRLTRRQLLQAGAGATLISAMSHAGLTSGGGHAESDADSISSPVTGKRRQNRLIGFTPLPAEQSSGPLPSISRDYRYQVLIPWGDPLEQGGPPFRHPPNSRDQARQIGIGHDGLCYFALGNPKDRDPNRHGLLVVNHEYGKNRHLLGKNCPDSLEEVRASQHAHGISIVEIEKTAGKWRHRKSDKCRRLHVNSPVSFSGPVAGHALLQTPNRSLPLGTLNNCACGRTPWGTYLTCEENFDDYFGATQLAQPWRPSRAQARYGLNEKGAGYDWHRFDPRFDLSYLGYRNEENRFGWIVEIDPMDVNQVPVKRTALGRFKHEGIAIAVGKGNRVVAYMGDDQAFDYIYKFVSADDWNKMRRRGLNPLDEGRLYAARFDGDGRGQWLELTIENPVLADRFSDQAELLTFVRMAADLLGATPMDRPEWTTVAPDQSVFCALTKNKRRAEANPANPLIENAHGHILRWKDDHRHVGDRFSWEMFLMARDTHGTENGFRNPDGLWADPDGRLFIQTDGDQTVGEHGDCINNQLLVADIKTGEVKRLFSGVSKAEVTGITTTPDRRSLFVNLQHPGKGDPCETNFPAPTDGCTVPRDCTIVISRKDGGIVGS